MPAVLRMESAGLIPDMPNLGMSALPAEYPLVMTSRRTNLALDFRAEWCYLGVN